VQAGADALSPHPPKSVEPLPPEVLELVALGPMGADGQLEVEAVISPIIDAEVDVEILSPMRTHFPSHARKMRYRLRRGEAKRRVRLQVDLSSGQATDLRVRLTLLDDLGEPRLSLDRSLSFNQPAGVTQPARVPVLRRGPDGRRFVEYMSPAEARSRPDAAADPGGGGDRAATATPQPSRSDAPDQGGDAVLGPVVQE